MARARREQRGAMSRAQRAGLADELRQSAGVIDAKHRDPHDQVDRPDGGGECDGHGGNFHAVWIGAPRTPIQRQPQFRTKSSVSQRIHCASMLGRLVGFLRPLHVVLVCAVLGSPARAQSVDVELLHFGVGDIVRGGGPIAAQFQFRSGLDHLTEIEAVWEVPNADLDISEHSRRFVLTPGQAQRRWLYATLPPFEEGTMAGSIFDLRLYEIEGGERVRDLGTVKVAPSTAENPPKVLGLADDAFLLVGPRAAGLDIFGQGAQNGAIPSMNVVTVCGNVRDADGFPDRWEGLAAFDAIVWADGSVAPARLTEESARALLLWVERGGNLVIALPSAGDPWSIGVATRHRLSGLLPSVAPERIDDVPLAEILPMLSLSDTLRDPNARTRLAVFDPARLDRGWRPFLATPAPKGADGAVAATAGAYDGLLVGVRREYGFGHITLLGVDVEELASRGLQVPAIPQGDVFWNRILGRRADTPSGAEYTALEDAARLVGGGGFSKEIGDGKAIAEKIGLAGQAAFGVLAATLVFGLYWLVAGPLGFAALRAFKRERWAWVAYVGVAAVFTLSIWAIGGTLSGRGAVATHFTVLDMIERAPGEQDVTQAQRRRVTSWISVYTPAYGAADIVLDEQGDPALRNLLTSWRPVGSNPDGFPSRERSPLPLDSPNRAQVPSRATTVDFKVDWLGAIREGWGQMPSVSQPIAVSVGGGGGTQTIAITGSLVHHLPGTLRDVRLLHIWPKQNPLQALAPAEEGKVAVRRFVGQFRTGRRAPSSTWRRRCRRTPGCPTGLGSSRRLSACTTPTSSSRRAAGSDWSTTTSVSTGRWRCSACTQCCIHRATCAPSRVRRRSACRGWARAKSTCRTGWSSRA
jgi:hypothetical protein